jgi:hypothetical protein
MEQAILVGGLVADVVGGLMVKDRLRVAGKVDKLKY